ncbi:MaoC/PaaZ C-terminal domain-containing protein [Streptomyces vilmorinianum]|uniref:MaoC family dehydratase n=1 Tax=Streptomyces vilmorinianum TaxID=3051092 RepID=UPI0010FB3A56|nr:MaoC/PaaZ C-terminal domain-containing protein [Streptomyces vilmorinianum]
MRNFLALAGAVARSPFTKVRPDAPLPRTRIESGPRRIDGDHLAAYARICGFPPEERSLTLPLTYPHVLGFPAAMRLMARRDFPLPLLGLVHTWITITRHAPLTADDRPEITVYARTLSPHRRGTEVTMVTQARLAGQLVWESTSGYLARHARPAGSPPRSPAPPPLPETAEWRLPADLGRRYAAVSGDRNPIHLHPLTARAFGFPGTVAHGMWTFARCLAERDPSGELPYARAEFKAPVLLPGVVSYAAGDSGRFQLRNGDRLHLTGVTGEGGESGEPGEPGEETSARSS